ncbi:DUF3006 domain-containing protein [Paenibacillus physcomitrellae]|uniref:DUF3006 domain-containing protein n=1 Tax=Paenibacillus physcomitrellae TaxID=1619311 RepID=A0ABQ1FMV8_9BACL|nr:DUF3006 domain-containing protein [Paenibacillus physcomitrellae]GGA21360.1 hypothetical protein GCM10010917_02590 [Paenibacillus physcomitrellae]
MEAAVLEGFEGNYAIIEINGETRDIERKLVEAKAKEGDVLNWDGEKWVVDPEATSERSSRIKKLMDELWED